MTGRGATINNALRARWVTFSIVSDLARLPSVTPGEARHGEQVPGEKEGRKEGEREERRKRGMERGRDTLVLKLAIVFLSGSMCDLNQ